MSPETRARALQLREAGKTYREIGAALSYHREHIRGTLAHNTDTQDVRVARKHAEVARLRAAGATWLQIAETCGFAHAQSAYRSHRTYRQRTAVAR